MRDPVEGKLYSIGTSTEYVIVTFQYGKAVGVRTNDTESCRVTFAPRPPGAAFNNPITVHPINTCLGLNEPWSALAEGEIFEPAEAITGDTYNGDGSTE